MQKRSSKPKRPTDPNLLARQIIEEAIGEPLLPVGETKPEKNPAAVALGRLGGLKGGKARADKLSASRKKTIARKAAKARWRSRNT